MKPLGIILLLAIAGFIGYALSKEDSRLKESKTPKKEKTVQTVQQPSSYEASEP